MISRGATTATTMGVFLDQAEQSSSQPVTGKNQIACCTSTSAVRPQSAPRSARSQTADAAPGTCPIDQA